MASLRQDLAEADAWKLSPSSSSALRRAEAVRVALGSHEVTSEMLLYGLLGKSTGAAYCILGAVDGEDPRGGLARQFGW
ncbi:MAG TPA: hypothetical protein VFK02_24285, partial [Kofleriaceae bacterium]|nr:hypothetical protein [Kofleriaceae bacterium]